MLTGSEIWFGANSAISLTPRIFTVAMGNSGSTQEALPEAVLSLPKENLLGMEPGREQRSPETQF
jgi:hypothetical protein